MELLKIIYDLSKVFECVHHSTLFSNLQDYRIKNQALDLLIFYLNERIQKVNIIGIRTTGHVVNMGIPQGFLLYINDLSFIVDKHRIVLILDVISFLFKAKRQINKYDEVINAIFKLIHWFLVNNLLLNGNNTKCIKFSTPNVKHVGYQCAT